jgi:hypothetical protein
MWESPHTVDCIPSRACVCLASNRRSPAESREDISSIFLRSASYRVWRLSTYVRDYCLNFCAGSLLEHSWVHSAYTQEVQQHQLTTAVTSIAVNVKGRLSSHHPAYCHLQVAASVPLHALSPSPSRSSSDRRLTLPACDAAGVHAGRLHCPGLLARVCCHTSQHARPCCL